MRSPAESASRAPNQGSIPRRRPIRAAGARQQAAACKRERRGGGGDTHARSRACCCTRGERKRPRGVNERWSRERAVSRRRGEGAARDALPSPVTLAARGGAGAAAASASLSGDR